VKTHRKRDMQRRDRHRWRRRRGERNIGIERQRERKKRGKERLGEREHTLYSPLIIVEPPYSKYCWTSL
jgi:hypothetical protein